jgi:hypothetical protein
MYDVHLNKMIQIYLYFKKNSITGERYDFLAHTMNQALTELAKLAP